MYYVNTVKQMAWWAVRLLINLAIIGLMIWAYATQRGIDVSRTTHQWNVIDEAYVKVMAMKDMNHLMLWTVFGDPDAPLFDVRDDVLQHIWKVGLMPCYLVYRGTLKVMVWVAQNHKFPMSDKIYTNDIAWAIVIIVQILFSPLYIIGFYQFVRGFFPPNNDRFIEEENDSKIPLGVRIGRAIAWLTRKIYFRR